MDNVDALTPVPGSFVVVQANTLWVWVTPVPSRNLSKKTVPDCTPAIILSVCVLNDRMPLHSTFCVCYSPEHGMFEIESSKLRVLWNGA